MLSELKHLPFCSDVLGEQSHLLHPHKNGSLLPGPFSSMLVAE